MLGTTLSAGDYLSRVCQEIGRLDVGSVVNLSDVIERAYDAGKFVFIIGNGGSGANASHLCEDLAKCTLRDFENRLATNRQRPSPSEPTSEAADD